MSDAVRKIEGFSNSDSPLSYGILTVKSGETIYEGEIVEVKTSTPTIVQKGGDDSGVAWASVALEGGAAGEKIRIAHPNSGRIVGPYTWGPTGASAADIGKVACIVDSQTVTTYDVTTNDVPLGVVAKVSEDGTQVWVQNVIISSDSESAAEAGRVQAESDRVDAEALRVTAEDGRDTAEGLRVTAESDRETAEGLRVTAEDGRVAAELLRAANVNLSVRADYDFATHGGGIGTIALDAELPLDAIVTNVKSDIITPFTSGGAATIAIVRGAQELMAALAYNDAGLTGIDDHAVGNVKITAAGAIGFVIADFALTAGKGSFIIEYKLGAPTA